MLPNDGVARHWMLNLAVSFPVQVRELCPVVRTERLNAKAIPGFAPDDYVAVLRELGSEGLIEIAGARDSGATDWTDGETSFQLTPRGGSVWEELANPDWNRLIEERSDLETCELMSPDRNLLMAYMGWYGELHATAIDLESVKVTHRANFPILYWKPLASVYLASFRLEPRASGRTSSRRLSLYPWFRDWTPHQWYRNPWDLPGWPA